MTPLQNLKAARIAAGMTQTQVARMIGVTQSHYGKIELGKVGFSAAQALILCRAFDLDINQLLT